MKKVFLFPVAKFEKVLNQSGIARLLQETSTILNQLMAAASRIYLKLNLRQMISYTWFDMSYIWLWKPGLHSDHMCHVSWVMRHKSRGCFFVCISKCYFSQLVSQCILDYYICNGLGNTPIWAQFWPKVEQYQKSGFWYGSVTFVSPICESREISHQLVAIFRDSRNWGFFIRPKSSM